MTSNFWRLEWPPARMLSQILSMGFLDLNFSSVILKYKEAGTKVYMGNFSASNTNVELTRFLKVFDSDDTLRRNAPRLDYTQEEEIIKQIIKEHINDNESNGSQSSKYGSWDKYENSIMRNYKDRDKDNDRDPNGGGNGFGSSYGSYGSR